LFILGTRNPTPGIIINHPEGKDVYGGVVIDYKGKVSYISALLVTFNFAK